MKVIDREIQPHASNENESVASEGSEKDRRSFSKGLILITIMSALLYVLISACWPKFSRAEVFFSECAREMIATSNFVTPLYHGQAFFDKPILVYWFIIGCFKTFGITHFSARIPSILASLATLVVTAFACRSVYGTRPALIATMALATSFMYLSFSALCMSDAMLVLVDTVTLSLLWAGLYAGEAGTNQTGAKWRYSRTTWWFLAAASMGVGFLTKGPVAVVLPAVFFLLYLFSQKQLKTVKFKHVALGALALCLIGAPWFVLAYMANGMEAITYFFIGENVQRFAGTKYDTHKPVYFMVVSLLGGFLPWSIFLPAILVSSVKAIRAQASKIDLYLWLWIAVAIGFFSFSRGKIDYYALPAFPACAMLVGHYISKWIDNGAKLNKVAAGALNVALILTGIGMGIFLSMLPFSPTASPVVVGLVPVTIGIVGLTMLGKQKTFASYATIFSGVILTGSVFAMFGMPVLTKMQPALHYADAIKADSSSRSAKIGMFAGIEHWVDEVTFRTEREPVKLANQGDLNTFLATPGQHWLMIKNGDFDALPEETKSRLDVVQRQGFIPKSINPGYIFRNKGNLTGGSELILARSK